MRNGQTTACRLLHIGRFATSWAKLGGEASRHVPRQPSWASKWRVWLLMPLLAPSSTNEWPRCRAKRPSTNASTRNSGGRRDSSRSTWRDMRRSQREASHEFSLSEAEYQRSVRRCVAAYWLCRRTRSRTDASGGVEVSRATVRATSLAFSLWSFSMRNGTMAARSSTRSSPRQSTRVYRHPSLARGG